jgi:hypothetical protein
MKNRKKIITPKLWRVNCAALMKLQPNHSGGDALCVLKVAVRMFGLFYSVNVRLLMVLAPEFVVVDYILGGKRSKRNPLFLHQAII